MSVFPLNKLSFTITSSGGLILTTNFPLGSPLDSSPLKSASTQPNLPSGNLCGSEQPRLIYFSFKFPDLSKKALCTLGIKVTPE